MDEQLAMIEGFFTAKGLDSGTVQSIKDQSKVGFKLYSQKKIKQFLGINSETKPSNSSMIMQIMTMAIMEI